VTPVAVTLYDVVLWLHITAVVVAFGALFAYPILLAVNAQAPLAERATFHRAQIAFSKRVTGPAIGVVLLAGVYLATDAEVWDEGWVGIPLVLLFVRRPRGHGAAPRRGAPRGALGGGRRARLPEHAGHRADVGLHHARADRRHDLFMTAKPF
jgi:hypothetical protein